MNSSLSMQKLCEYLKMTTGYEFHEEFVDRVLSNSYLDFYEVSKDVLTDNQKFWLIERVSICLTGKPWSVPYSTFQGQNDYLHEFFVNGIMQDAIRI